VSNIAATCFEAEYTVAYQAKKARAIHALKRQYSEDYKFEKIQLHPLAI
jgi:hypothetical protein